ncbi:MAG: CBS domain-containing protein [Armatimonadota bacterium]
MRVLEFINTHAPTLRLDSTLQDAIDKLDLYQVTLLPVLDEAGAVRGIVTERQLFARLFEPYLQAQAAGKPLSLAELRRRVQAQTPITQWMMPDPPLIDERAPIEQAVELMHAHGLDTLPVIGEGRFVGTVRLVDCCQALLEDNP